jgi:hypothetical protein
MSKPTHDTLLTYSRNELNQYFKSQNIDELKTLCGQIYRLRYVEYKIEYENIYSLLSTHIIQRTTNMLDKIKMNPKAYGYNKNDLKEFYSLN